MADLISIGIVAGARRYIVEVEPTGNPAELATKIAANLGLDPNATYKLIAHDAAAISAGAVYDLYAIERKPPHYEAEPVDEFFRDLRTDREQARSEPVTLEGEVLDTLQQAVDEIEGLQSVSNALNLAIQVLQASRGCKILLTSPATGESTHLGVLWPTPTRDAT